MKGCPDSDKKASVQGAQLFRCHLKLKKAVMGLIFKENGPNFTCISEMKNYENFNEIAQS